MQAITIVEHTMAVWVTTVLLGIDRKCLQLRFATLQLLMYRRARRFKVIDLSKRSANLPLYHCVSRDAKAVIIDYDSTPVHS